MFFFFSENLTYFDFLLPPSWDSSFGLITDDTFTTISKYKTTVGTNIPVTTVWKRISFFFQKTLNVESHMVLKNRFSFLPLLFYYIFPFLSYIPNQFFLPGWKYILNNLNLNELKKNLNFGIGKCRRDCRREKRNHCITSALFCRHAFFCHFKSSKLSKKTTTKKKRRKISIPKQIRAYYMFQGIIKIFSNIYAWLFIFSKL